MQILAAILIAAVGEAAEEGEAERPGGDAQQFDDQQPAHDRHSHNPVTVPAIFPGHGAALSLRLHPSSSAAGGTVPGVPRAGRLATNRMLQPAIPANAGIRRDDGMSWFPGHRRVPVADSGISLRFNLSHRLLSANRRMSRRRGSAAGAAEKAGRPRFQRKEDPGTMWCADRVSSTAGAIYSRAP